MPAPGPPAYELYARLLFPLGYGYPLWSFSGDDNDGPTRVGDVGRLLRGGFHKLFNTMEVIPDRTSTSTATSNSESDSGLGPPSPCTYPEDFEPLSASGLYISQGTRIAQPYVTSKGVVNVRDPSTDSESGAM